MDGETFDLVVSLDCLESVEFADIGAVNVLIGPNNSGKSTFLRAMQRHAWIPQIPAPEHMHHWILKIREASVALDSGTWKSNHSFSGDFSKHINDVQRTRIPKINHQLRQPTLCLWHRRKSNYTSPMSYEEKLDAEVTNMAPRMVRILASAPDLGLQINTFMRDVIPGCPAITADYIDKTNVVIRVGSHPLQKVGGGVEQTLAIAIALLAEQPDCTLLIDEPETNLHPSSQRTLVRKMMQLRGERRLFITTHSPVVLNEFARHDDVRIYRMHPNMPKEFRIEPCRTSQHLRAALDSVGARASDLLQTDFALWVEGPTEAIVLRHLLDLFHPNRYVESTHYQFMFSGGALIKHIGTDDNRLIDALKVCRHAFMLFDRDAAPASTPSDKDRVRPGIPCEHTWGYEIEWYYPRTLVTQRLPNVDAEQLYGTSRGAQPFFEAVKDAGGPKSLSKSKTNFALDMVEASEALGPDEAKRLWLEGEAGQHLRDLLTTIANLLNRAIGQPSDDTQ